jgi:rubrerythrin
MDRKDLRDLYKEALREWRENYRDALREWKERFRRWKEQAKDEIARGSLPPLPPIPSVPSVPPLSLPSARSNVVASRIGDDDLKLIDMLIEAGLFKTRSEAVAYLVNEGIKARQDIIKKVSSALEEIRRIRRQAEEQVEKLRRDIGLAETTSEAAEQVCPQCGKDLSDLPEDIRVCPYCGAKLSK